MTDSHLAQLARDTLRLGGEDRRAFLQGLISNDMALCTPGAAIYAALLTPQGKFLHDFFVVDDGGSLLIDCAAGESETLLQKLKAHKLRARVTLDNVSADYGLWAAWGADAPKAEGWMPDPRMPELGMRRLAPKSAVRGANANAGDYDRFRLSLGVTDGAKDMLSGKSTLQEGNIDRLNGISWSKGCYMGQELTARIHYRGLVKKRLFKVHIDGAAPAFGSVITSAGKDCGDMRSSNGGTGLALLDLETVGQTKNFACATATLTVAAEQLVRLSAP